MDEIETGKYIRGCIEARGLNVTHVAIKSKITRQTLYNIMNGKNYTFKNVKKVCNVLGIDFSELLKKQKNDTSEDTTAND